MNEFEQPEEVLFEKCLELPPERWEDELKSLCPEDPERRATVLRLLKATRKVEGFMESPPEADTAGVAERLQKIAPAEESQGDQIGRYHLLELIGEGAWGSVWMAQQTEDIDRRVALKILKLGLDTKDFLARFEAERQMLAMMDHPNIATVLDAGATDYGRPYLVMELVRGMPLLEFADRNRLSIEARVRLFVKICQAMQHAHQKGIIHRDLKPSNILVSMQDDEAVPKVIDFGVAKSNQFRLTDKTLFTSIHTFIGTPIYSSPEQLEFTGSDVDPRSDIYSLGALFYELLCGKTPFDYDRVSKEGMEAFRTLLREKDPARPSQRFGNLPPSDQSEIAANRGSSASKFKSCLEGDLDWIIMKCLEKNPSRRYESSIQLAKDLKAYLQKNPVSAVAPSVSDRIRKSMTEKRRSNFLLIAIPTLLFGAIAIFLYLNPRERIEPNAMSMSMSDAELPITDKSIAVLPLENLSPDPENGFFADGVQGEVINNLSKISELLVTGRTSTLQYRDSVKTLKQIASELDVRYLVEGSVLRDGEDIRVSVRLIDVQTDGDGQVWGSGHDREVNDFLDIITDIAKDIASELHAVISPEEIELIERIPTKNQEAYDYFLKGNLEKGGKRLANYEKAVALDPDFAEAWAFLASFRSVFWAYVKKRNDPDFLASINRAMEKAISINPNLPHVLWAQGVVTNYVHGDEEIAIEYFLKALEQDPSFWYPKRSLGRIYYGLGRLAEAQYYLEDALRTDSISGEQGWLADVYTLRRLLPEARSLIEKNIMNGDVDDGGRVGFWSRNLAWVDYLETGDKAAYASALYLSPGYEDSPPIRSAKLLIEQDFQAALQSIDEIRLDTVRSTYGITGPGLFRGTIVTQPALIWFIRDNKDKWLFEVAKAKSYLRGLIERDALVENDIPTDPIFWSNLAICYALEGDREEMDSTLAKIREITAKPTFTFRRQARCEVHIAICYLILGDNDKAIETLEAANKMNDSFVLNRYVDPWFIFDRLRGNPRFDALLED